MEQLDTREVETYGHRGQIGRCDGVDQLAENVRVVLVGRNERALGKDNFFDGFVVLEKSCQRNTSEGFMLKKPKRIFFYRLRDSTSPK